MDIVGALYNNEKYCDISINDVKFHKCVLCQIEYFENTLLYQHEILDFKITEECAKLFKKWLYKQDIHKSELTLELGIEIHEMSKFLDIEFFTDIKNQLFVCVLESDTSDIQFEYFKTFNRYDNRFNITKQQVDSLDKSSNAYALCLQRGIECVKDEKVAFELYKTNWEQNKNCYSLHNYAHCLEKGIGCTKDEKTAFELYKMNWDQNKNSDSLNNYAYCLQCGVGCAKDEKTAFELYKMNWEQNKNSYSLNGYAYCLHDGIGCTKDEQRAIKLHQMNWEQNKNSDSLHNYAYCIEKGIGCVKDEKMAFKLYKINWNHNKCISSLQNYVHCLRNGIGCSRDTELASAMISVFHSSIG